MPCVFFVPVQAVSDVIQNLVIIDLEDVVAVLQHGEVLLLDQHGDDALRAAVLDRILGLIAGPRGQLDHVQVAALFIAGDYLERGFDDLHVSTIPSSSTNCLAPVTYIVASSFFPPSCLNSCA